MSLLLAGLSSGLQVQASSPPTSTPAVTPKLLKGLADLVKASGGMPKAESFWSPEHIQAYAAAVGAVAWPVTVLLVVIFFRKPIHGFLSNVTDVEIAGAKFKRLQQELSKADAEASKRSVPFSPPTEADQTRATTIEELLEGAHSLIRQQAESLAFEYERVRASMLPGPERTRSMEVVVAKMRAIGRAVYPFRHELAASSSPGKRLQAIAALEVAPDYDMLDWLAERLKAEKPFLGFHALIALNQAAQGPGAAANQSAITSALKIVQVAKGSFGSDTDRYKLLQSFEELVARLQNTSEKGS